MTEDGFQDWGRQLQLPVERCEGTNPIEMDPPRDQIHNQRPRDIEGLSVAWRWRNTSRSEGRLLHGRHYVVSSKVDLFLKNLDLL